MKPTYFFLSLLLFAVFGCENKPNEEAALLELFQKEKALNCQLASMKDSITTEWDNINHLLQKNLPTDMPAEEKTNMLKVRNASLIRMFQSFDDVDEGVKMALDKTEQLDMEMTKRITVLKKEAQKIESEKIVLFQKINEASGADEVSRFKDLHQSVLSENCN
ncbi:MAG: hypothetical protein H6577_12925 [Lewinellaceae bacterium]|nr:hypothetical protein [Lewinellaceae bacterium]